MAIMSLLPTRAAPVGHLFIRTLLLDALLAVSHSCIYVLAECASVAHKPDIFPYFCCMTVCRGPGETGHSPCGTIKVGHSAAQPNPA